MANNFDPSSLWSPVALWTDLSLRALDMTMSSSQSLTEGVDRFARAGASVEATEGEASTASVSSDLWSPVALWTDLSLRALDMTVSSSQTLTEGVDRFARAGASVEASEGEASTAAVSDRSASVASSGVALAVDLQRSAFDQLMRGWVQWMSMLGDFASLGAGLLLPSLNRRNPALELTRKVLLAAGESPATQARKGSSSRQPSGSRLASGFERSMEHAFASAEPKRRRSSGTSRSKPKSKARRSRGS